MDTMGGMFAFSGLLVLFLRNMFWVFAERLGGVCAPHGPPQSRRRPSQRQQVPLRYARTAPNGRIPRQPLPSLPVRIHSRPPGGVVAATVSFAAAHAGRRPLHAGVPLDKIAQFSFHKLFLRRYARYFRLKYLSRSASGWGSGGHHERRPPSAYRSIAVRSRRGQLRFPAAC